MYQTYTGLSSDGNGISTQLRSFLLAAPSIRRSVEGLDVRVLSFGEWDNLLADVKELVHASGVELSLVAPVTGSALWGPALWQRMCDAFTASIELISGSVDQMFLVICDVPLAGLLYSPLPDNVVRLFAPYSVPSERDTDATEWLASAFGNMDAKCSRVLSFATWVERSLVERFSLSSSSVVAFSGGVSPSDPIPATAEADAILADYQIDPAHRFVAIGRDDPQKGLGQIAMRFDEAGLADQLLVLAPQTHRGVCDPLLEATHSRVIRTFDRRLTKALVSLPTMSAVICGGSDEPLSNIVFEVALWSSNALVVAPDTGGYPEQLLEGAAGVLYAFDEGRTGVVEASSAVERLPRAARQRMLKAARHDAMRRDPASQYSRLVSDLSSRRCQ